jgi:hypothetical protein
MAFSGPEGFTQAIYSEPAVTSCLVDRLASYASGRKLEQPYYKEWVINLESVFEQGGFRVPDLMREIALSDALYDLPSDTAATTLAQSLSDSTSQNIVAAE